MKHVAVAWGVVACTLLFTNPLSAEWQFIRGDVTGNGSLDISDPVLAIRVIFLDEETNCEDAVDVNDDGMLDIVDVVYSLDYQFNNGAEPPAPFPFCGSDPSDDIAPISCDGPLVGCDAEPVSVAVTTPREGALLNSSTVSVVVSFGGEPLEAVELTVTVDGVEVDLGEWTILPMGASGELPPLEDGDHDLVAALGSVEESVSFSISTGGGVTTVTGLLLDPDGDTPIVDATVYLEEDPGSAVTTDENGAFTIEPELTGEAHLVFDPSELDFEEDGESYEYPVYKRPIEVVSGATVAAATCYLPKVFPTVFLADLGDDIFDCDTFTFTADYELENEELDVIVYIPEGTVLEFSGGKDPCDGALSIAPVDPEKAPSNLPPGVDPQLLITVQPTGMRFLDSVGGDPVSLAVSFPNTDELPAGNEVAFFSVDHETGTFVVKGLMEVDEDDNERLITIEGGLEGGSWHCTCALGLPAEPDEEEEDGRFQCQPTNPVVSTETGFVSQVFSLPRRTLFGSPWGLDLVYFSGSLVPSTLVRLDTVIARRAAVPKRISVTGSIDGIPVGNPVWFDSREFPENDDSAVTLSYEFPLEGFSTGLYPYRLEVVSHFKKSTATTFVTGDLAVIRRPDSPFGRGWSLTIDDRLVEGEDGRVVIFSGGSGATKFAPVLQLETTVAGDVVVETDVPKSLEFGDSTDDLFVRLFVEQLGVELEEDLEIDVVDGGTYDRGNQMMNLTIAEGTVVDSYLLHMDTEGTDDVTMSGTATFAAPILGVIKRNPKLDDSDLVLGVAESYQPGQARSIEFGNNGDEFTISADGLTLDFSFEVSTSVDNLRIVTEAVDFGIVGYREEMGTSTLTFGDDGEFFRMYSDGAVDTFDETGCLVVRADRIGRETILSRDAAGEITSVTDPAEGVITFGWEDGRVTMITEETTGRETQLEQIDGELVTITDAVSTEWEYEYDDIGLLVGSTNDLGADTSHEYDSFGRFLRTTYADSTTRTITALNSCFLAELGEETTEAYPIELPGRGDMQALYEDERGRQVFQGLIEVDALPDFPRVRGVSHTEPVGDKQVRTTVRTIDRKTGLPLVVEVFEGDPEDGLTLEGRIEFEWDTTRRLLLSQTRVALDGEDDRVIRYEWDEERSWLLARIIGADGAEEIRTEFDRDADTGQITELREDLPEDGTRTTTFVYGDAGVLEEVVSASDVVTTYVSDAGTGNVTSITVGDRETEFTLCPSGSVESVTTAGGTTTYTRDELDRILEVEHPGDEDEFTETHYDEFGRIEWVRDANTEAADDAPRHTFEYDSRGRLARWCTPLEKETSYAYRPDGQLSLITAADGTSTSIKYNDAGRPVRIEYRAQSDDKDPQDYTDISYGPLGRVVAMESANGSEIHVSYNSLGDVVEDQQVDPDGIAATLTYDYDALGRLTTVGVCVGDETVDDRTYSYDKNFLTNLVSSASGSFDLSYDSTTGFRVELARGDDLVTTYEYDLDTNAMNAVETSLKGELMARDEIVFNNDFNIESVSLTRSLLAGSESTTTFSYDARRQLLSAENLDVPELGGDYGPYDAVGNRNSDTYIYDAGDRLSEDETYTYDWDDLGQLTERAAPGEDTREYEYDLHGRLTAILDDGSTVVEYSYDPLGRRTSVTIDGETVRYIYDGDHIAATLDGDGSVTRVMTHGPAFDEVWAVTLVADEDEVRHIGLDIHGSVIQVFDDEGIRSEYAYDAFGQIVVQEGSDDLGDEILFGYRGREYDAVSGLYYNRARYLDPRTGRFLTPEPLLLGALAGQVPGGTNPYVYALNNPGSFEDRDGRAARPGGYLQRGWEKIKDKLSKATAQDYLNGAVDQWKNAMDAVAYQIDSTKAWVYDECYAMYLEVKRNPQKHALIWISSSVATLVTHGAKQVAFIGGFSIGAALGFTGASAVVVSVVGFAAIGYAIDYVIVDVYPNYYPDYLD